MTVTDLVVTNDVHQLEQLTRSAQEASVTLYLTEARDKLAQAVEMTGPAAVAAVKAEIATAADATKHLGLSKEIQADAQEMVRRAEYALGKAIRAGQADGTVRKPGQSATVFDRWNGTRVESTSSTKAAPTDFVSQAELSGGGSGIYALADEATPEQFDEALAEAKAEGNVSRANVVRKIRGDEAPKGDRPEVLRGTHRLNSNRIVSGVVLGALVPTSVLEHVDYTALDRDQLGEWIDSLSESPVGLEFADLCAPGSEVPYAFDLGLVKVSSSTEEPLTPEGAVPAQPAPSALNSTVCPECRHIGGVHDDGVLSGSGRVCSRSVGAGAR